MTQLGEVAPCRSPLAVMCGIDRRRRYLACKVKTLVILPTFIGGLEDGIAEVQASSSVLQKDEWFASHSDGLYACSGSSFRAALLTQNSTGQEELSLS